MSRAAEITFETGVIVYDTLFLALAEDSQTVVILPTFLKQQSPKPPTQIPKRCAGLWPV